jgi:hypothetical protein
MLRELLAFGMKPRLIAQKMKRSIGAIQSRMFLFKKPRKRLTVRPTPDSDARSVIRGPFPPQAVDVPFLVTASELRDRKAKRRRKQDDLPGRSEAIRGLVAIGLKAKK